MLAEFYVESGAAWKFGDHGAAQHDAADAVAFGQSFRPG